MRRKLKKYLQPNKSIFYIVLTISWLYLGICPAFSGVAQAQTAGATLFLSPSTGTFGINSQLSIKVKLNSSSDFINAAEGGIYFDAKLLEATGFSKTGSILSLWTSEPSFDNKAGNVVFGGGTPRPGFQGNNGQVLTINFKAKAAGNPIIRFSSGAVLANDGKGTNILIGLGSASLTISPEEIPPQNGTPTAGQEQKADGEEYNRPVVSSPTHPDQNIWYREKNIVLQWVMPEGTSDISFDLNQEALADPDNKPETLAAETKYENIENSVWYFHIKFKDGKKWGTVAHFRLMVDNIPPDPFNIEIRQVQINDWPEIKFECQDKGSGIKQYNIIIGSLDNQAFVVPVEEKQFKLSGLSPGKHTAMIVAIDNAGNQTVKTIDFKIEPIETPIINNYSQEIKSGDKFFISGTSIPNASIFIFFANNDKSIASSTIKADGNGNWFFVNEMGLQNGQYTLWAEAMNENGLKSYPTNRVSFLVSPPVFAKIGSWVINYFTVFASLLFMIILIVISIVYLAKMIRRRLKKETIEVEYVLHRNFMDLGEIVDEEFADLNKLAGTTAYNKERIKLKQRIKNYITEAEKKIMKEIKDVEEILK